MASLITEIPLNQRITTDQFLSQAFTWLDGVRASRILDGSDKELADTNEFRLGRRGQENLFIRKLEIDGDPYHALQHELPDEDGRLWRTEFVHSPGKKYGVLSFVSQCRVVGEGARADVPRRPHIIRQCIDDGWIGPDGKLEVSHGAHYLPDSNEGVELAASIVNG
jgi:hypothetical protein